jgi:hypothetical protein
MSKPESEGSTPPTEGHIPAATDHEYERKIYSCSAEVREPHFNFTSTANSSETSTGPLAFLNTYRYPLMDTSLLTGVGTVTEVNAGATFWNCYGRTLYNATVGQLAYIVTSLMEPPVPQWF